MSPPTCLPFSDARGLVRTVALSHGHGHQSRAGGGSDLSGLHCGLPRCSSTGCRVAGKQRRREGFDPARLRTRKSLSGSGRAVCHVVGMRLPLSGTTSHRTTRSWPSRPGPRHAEHVLRLFAGGGRGVQAGPQAVLRLAQGRHGQDAGCGQHQAESTCAGLVMSPSLRSFHQQFRDDEVKQRSGPEREDNCEHSRARWPCQLDLAPG